MKKQYKIKKSKEIDAVIHNKKRYGSMFFVIYYKENNYDHYRLAISIGKKYGIAVERNKIKRQIRSIIRHIDLPKLDYVVVVKKDAKKLKFNKMEKILLKQFNVNQKEINT